MFKRVIKLFLVVSLLLLIGTLFYHQVEKWRYLDSLYFSAMTITTIGYGDFSPKTDLGKIFTILFAMSGIGLFFYMASMLTRSLRYIGFSKSRKRDNYGFEKVRKK